MRAEYVLSLVLAICLTTASPVQNRRRTAFSLRPDEEKRQSGRVQAPGFTWGSEPMRGVNIGGWLVLEPWITPSLFENKPDWVVDEWTYGAYMRSRSDTMREIRQHWNTWFQFDQLENIARVGLNTIRIQIGYWAVIPLENDEPFLVGAYDYLKLAVTWAQSLNLKVMIDLHGAPGSQNGFDNSGIRGRREWFWNQTNIDRTLNALTALTSEFTRSTYGNTVQTIELINEPFPWTADELNTLKQFYQSAYSAVDAAREDGHGTMVVAIDAAFQGLDAWDGFMTEPQFHNVALDDHIYAMFDNNLLSMGYNQNLEWTCSQLPALIESNQQHWTIVGEFTPAHTDCAFWLNGKGRGARYDNTLNSSAPIQFPGKCDEKTGDGTNFGADYIDHLARSFETQTWVYEQASGWIMWTWKTERAADWSMQQGITYGWIPTPITAKPHGTPCNFTIGSSGQFTGGSRRKLSSIRPITCLTVAALVAAPFCFSFVA